MGNSDDKPNNNFESEDKSKLSEDGSEIEGLSVSGLADPLTSLDTSNLINPLGNIDPKVFDLLAGLGSSELVNPMSNIDPQVFDPLTGLGTSEMIDPMSDIHLQVFDPLAGLDTSELVNPMGNIDPKVFQLMANLDLQAFDPLGGLNPKVFQPTASLDMSALALSAGELENIGTRHYLFQGSEISGTSADFESPTTQPSQENIEETSSLSSEIQSFLHQAQAEIAYQRTYSALKIAGERINDKHLFFITSTLLTSLPRFLPLEPAIAAAVVGNLLAIHHYMSEQEE
ncbi:hypothetical protein [Halalkalicoccus salilacus]|uniref:hypothetical protein n=1 Tax=Halalkalicoccus salilacus TaxID=3117459 RepID=UPI00300E7D52